MTIKMVVDASNILFRTSAMIDKKHGEVGGQFESDEEKSAYALFSALQSFNKYYRKYKPNEMAIAFEGGKNWRKIYTKDKTEGVKQYKANRLLTDKSQTFFDLIDSFKILVKEHTSMLCLAVEGLEGDDVIAEYVRESAQNPEDKIIIISGDKDFMQLGKFKNVMLIDPASGKDRIKEEPDFDADYFMFEKCIRGDGGDNVMSAFPRVRKTRLEKAYKDDYEFIQLMEETWTSPKIDIEGNAVLNEDGTFALTTNRVGDIYAHNKILMDLEAQPEHIKEKMKEGIIQARAAVGKYNNFHFMRFLGKYKLNAIAEQAHLYTDMLSTHALKNQIKQVTETGKIKADGAINASTYLNLPDKTNSLLEY